MISFRMGSRTANSRIGWNSDLSALFKVSLVTNNLKEFSRVPDLKVEDWK